MQRNLKRVVMILASSLLLFFGFAASAQATTDFSNAPSGAHYASGSSEPVCSWSGATATCSSTVIGGIGHTNATVNLTVTTTFTGYCYNPGNPSKPVTPFTKSVSQPTVSDKATSRNGQIAIPQVSATGLTAADFAYKCPNRNWTPVVNGPTYSYAYAVTFAGFSQPVISQP
ncbi:hypothetical protein GCM10027449_03190 [Sinomonas notoginsengisoli]|uniref:hypothetical protein n=1 Tax=Sinomonas notoginsengisoli TaxID=1457311 RepID=UPI001F3DDF6F|nr:hypothetical protein [Sinomonas notoginsengisoli]